MTNVTPERLEELLSRFCWYVSLVKANADNENYSVSATIAELKDAIKALRELESARTRIKEAEQVQEKP